MVAKKAVGEMCSDLIERKQYRVDVRSLYTGYVLSGSLLSPSLTGILKDSSEALSNIEDKNPIG